jgi:pimeloyl-ACP methyl ester carboxylesterase
VLPPDVSDERRDDAGGDAGAPPPEQPPAAAIADDRPPPRRLRRTRRVLRIAGLTLLSLFVLATLASLVYDLATTGREKPATALYGGPFVRVDGGLVAYRAWGSTGTPIVLLGGFAEPTFVWQDVAPRLAASHRVVAIDLPPFGFSERRGGATLAEWVRLVRGTARALGLERPLYVGHSLGAGVAAALALDHPAETRGIVLLDGDALASGGGRGFVSHLLVDPWYTSLYRLLSGSDTFVRAILRRAYGPGHPPLTDALVHEWEAPFRVQGTADMFRRVAGHGIVGLKLSDLGRIRTPATVVWGARDDVDGVDAGRRSAAALHAPFLLIPGTGHLSMLVAPGPVAAAIGRAAG